MNIIHVCLTGQFNENYGYQDNLITKYHSRFGHNVTIIAPVLRGSDNGKDIEEVTPGVQIINDGITLIRLPYRYQLTKGLREKTRLYKGLFKTLDALAPEFIFIHGTQFLDVCNVVKYLKSKPGISLVADNHTDYYNSGRNWLSLNILHKVVWRNCAKILEPYCDKFFGVTPIRCEFLIDVYGIPRENVELLPLGADDEKLKIREIPNLRVDIRKKYNVSETDFLIVTGGKIDKLKNTHILLEAVKNIAHDSVKVVFFGSIEDSMKEKIDKLTDSKQIIYAGWQNVDDIYKLFFASDLIVFPGTHSVLWEQASATGVPCLFNRIKGMEHVYFSDDVTFNGDEVEAIESKLLFVMSNSDNYKKLLDDAKTNSSKLLYSNIAKKALSFVKNRGFV